MKVPAIHSHLGVEGKRASRPAFFILVELSAALNPPHESYHHHRFGRRRFHYDKGRTVRQLSGFRRNEMAGILPSPAGAVPGLCRSLCVRREGARITYGPCPAVETGLDFLNPVESRLVSRFILEHSPQLQIRREPYRSSTSDRPLHRAVLLAVRLRN